MGKLVALVLGLAALILLASAAFWACSLALLTARRAYQRWGADKLNTPRKEAEDGR